MLLCYRWDPATGRYSLAVLNAVRAGGLLTLVALGTLVTVALRRERRRNGRAEDVSPPMPPPAADAPRLP
jgi:protein SCO1/2